MNDGNDWNGPRMEELKMININNQFLSICKDNWYSNKENAMMLTNGYLRRETDREHIPTDIIGVCMAYFIELIVNKWDHNEKDEDGDIKLERYNTKITVMRPIFFKRKHFKATDVITRETVRKVWKVQVNVKQNSRGLLTFKIGVQSKRSGKEYKLRVGNGSFADSDWILNDGDVIMIKYYCTRLIFAINDKEYPEQFCIDFQRGTDYVLMADLFDEIELLLLS